MIDLNMEFFDLCILLHKDNKLDNVRFYVGSNDKANTIIGILNGEFPNMVLEYNRIIVCYYLMHVKFILEWYDLVLE